MGFGLIYYLNHMTQPDTIVPNPHNSQDYDRYAYGLNMCEIIRSNTQY